MTIIQTHLADENASDATQCEEVGKGRILWVPLPIRERERSLADFPARMQYVYRRAFDLCESAEYGKGQARFSLLRIMLAHGAGHLRHGTIVWSEHLPRLLAAQGVHLFVFHWLTYDTDTLILSARKAGVPFVFINHFDNARLSLPLMRKWMGHAAGIGVVSNQGIPPELRGRCVNLSDSVDTDFFAPERANAVGTHIPPVVLLPARIDHSKGHRDLMEVGRILKARNVDFVLCFAGAVESEPLHRDLRASAVAMGLDEKIRFLGELSRAELRDWYGRSSVVVLPSRSEGLGRILLEAQAMKKPVVAYDCGGMREAVVADETGFLVETGNLEAFADKLHFLLENQVERRRLGERGRDFVSHQFSVPALVHRHETFYLRALARNPEKMPRSLHQSSRP